MKYYLLVKDVLKDSTFLLNSQDETEFKNLVHKYSNDTDYKIVECRSVRIENEYVWESKIINARYSHQIDKCGYSQLIFEMSDGEEKVFHFNSRNFMPRIDKIIGMTWNELITYCKAITDVIFGRFI